jgi:cytochrome c peroxidase
VMWDGRESLGGRSIHADLMLQANDATVGHAQALPIDEATRQRIADFELRLTTAQIVDRAAGRLTEYDVEGGPSTLSTQSYRPGTGVFTLFTAWATAVGDRSAARQAIGRGQIVFNTAKHNDRLMCAGCHNATNVGTNAAAAFFNIGLTTSEERQTADIPLYTIQCHSGGQPIRTTDPGRALITGRCADVGKFKVPVLRGVASRAPYFHDGSAATLEDVVAHYEKAFQFKFVGTEKADLIAFLRAL